VDHNIRWQGANSASDRRPPTEPFEERVSCNRPDTAAYLIMISFLSLGLWAGIWGAVTSLLSALR
jgi:hypothetical protein